MTTQEAIEIVKNIVKYHFTVLDMNREALQHLIQVVEGKLDLTEQKEKKNVDNAS